MGLVLAKMSRIGEAEEVQALKKCEGVIVAFGMGKVSLPGRRRVLKSQVNPRLEHVEGDGLRERVVDKNRILTT